MSERIGNSYMIENLNWRGQYGNLWATLCLVVSRAVALFRKHLTLSAVIRSLSGDILRPYCLSSKFNTIWFKRFSGKAEVYLVRVSCNIYSVRSPLHSVISYLFISLNFIDRSYSSNVKQIEKNIFELKI